MTQNSLLSQKSNLESDQLENLIRNEALQQQGKREKNCRQKKEGVFLIVRVNSPFFGPQLDSGQPQSVRNLSEASTDPRPSSGCSSEVSKSGDDPDLKCPLLVR